MTTKSVYVLDQQETKKDTPTEVFFCEYFEIIKNIYSEEHLRTAASATSCLFSFKLVHLFKKKKRNFLYIKNICPRFHAICPRFHACIQKSFVELYL